MTRTTAEPPPLERRGLGTTIQFRRTVDRLVVEVRGELDLFTAPRLKLAVENLAAKGLRPLVIDVREVSFIDSAGLGVLVSAQRIARAAGSSLALCCRQQSFLRRVLDQTRLSTVFRIVADPEDTSSAPFPVAG